MGFMKPEAPPATPAPEAPPAAPPVQSPTGAKPKRRSMQPTFLGPDSIPAAGGAAGGKTLLGQ